MLFLRMPTKYKLTYFDARAIAEIARQVGENVLWDELG